MDKQRYDDALNRYFRTVLSASTDVDEPILDALYDAYDPSGKLAEERLERWVLTLAISAIVIFVLAVVVSYYLTIFVIGQCPSL